MSRARVFAAGVLAAVVVMLASTVPASAHDQLVSSTPEAGERLETSPERVSLTFSDEPLTLDGSGMTVLVVDAEGRDWVDGPPTVEGTTVTAGLPPGMPEAGYELRWQVVSADGHPISGVIPFTIGDAEPLAAAFASTGAAGGEQVQQEQSEQDAQPTSRVVLLGVGGAVIAVAAFAAIQLLRRRHHGAAAPDV